MAKNQRRKNRIQDKSGNFVTEKGAFGKCKFQKRVDGGYYQQPTPEKFMGRAQRLRAATKDNADRFVLGRMTSDLTDFNKSLASPDAKIVS